MSIMRILAFTFWRGLRNCIFILVILPFCSIAQEPIFDKGLYGHVGRPLSTIYNAKQHGGHNQNWTVMQAQTGLVYVGHTDGISQWDGEQWFNIDTPHITPVRSISEWQGNLYFGTSNDLASLEKTTTGEVVYKSLRSQYTFDASEFGEVWSSAANQYGVLFVSTSSTFFYDGNSVIKVEAAVSSKHFVFSLNNDFYYKPRNLNSLFKLESTTNDGKLSFTNTQLPGVLPEQTRVMEIMQISSSDLLVITEQHGLFRYDGKTFTQIKRREAFAKNAQLYDAILSSDGFYYISTTYDGLFILDSEFNILRNYREQDGIEMDTVFSVHEDKQGNIWLAGLPNIVKMRPAHIISEFKAGNTSTEILSLKNTPLGIIASGNGVFKLLPSTSAYGTPSFVRLNDNLESSVDLAEHNGKLIKSGRLGVFELELNAQLTSIIKEKSLIDVPLGRVIAPTSIENTFVVSSSDGAFLMRNIDEDWQIEAIKGIEDELVSLNIDTNNVLWLGSDKGKLYRVDNMLVSNPEINVYTQEHGLGEGPISLFSINGATIVSSAGKLLKLEGAELVDAKLPMFSEDWLADSRYIDGLVQTSATANAAERVWYRKNGQSGFFEKLRDGQWRENTFVFDSVESGGFFDMFLSEQDILWFVRDKDEIYRVDIKQALKLPAIASVNLRSLSSQNQAIDFTNQTQISIKPDQTNLRLTYASTDSSSPSPIQYRTRLNFQNELSAWSTWSDESYRDFTLVSPGKYVFEVQAKDAWSRTSSAKLSLIAIAPWYLSTGAYVFYIVLGFILIFATAWFIQKWRTHALEATNRELEAKIAERTQEVNEKVEQLRQQQVLKDRFFGNVSHEFRTPLTLTIGPLEVLIAEHKTELSENVKYLAKTALNNASKMLALVGQVLDLNRLEAGKLPLRITEHDMADLLRNIKERFDTWAQQNNQTIDLINCEEPVMLWFDIDQFDKCVSNLLSNAIKYSGGGANITLALKKLSNQVLVTVADNGVGISPGAKDKIFERFYQDKSSEQVSAPGTGIGLSLVKEIMDIHHGQAQLIDQEGDGCCFALTLLTGNEHFAPEQIIEPIEVSLPDLDTENTPSGDINETSSTNDSSMMPIFSNNDVTTLLVVDDNKELLNFISLRLSATYKILQANDGQEGLALALNELPDLIISDVNMPKMTGLELAKALKQNKETRTIPVILLTAKATKREIVEGFNVGADDYLTKPFDTSELIVRVNAQINARKLIRQTIQLAQQASPTPNKDSFKNKLSKIIQRHLVDPEFNVEQLAKLNNMSRNTLIRRCKKECADTPLNLIVQARMQQADSLLKQNTMSISEVAYACGFESLAYFSKSYKKSRGINPSEVH